MSTKGGMGEVPTGALRMGEVRSGGGGVVLGMPVSMGTSPPSGLAPASIYGVPTMSPPTSLADPGETQELQSRIPPMTMLFRQYLNNLRALDEFCRFKIPQDSREVRHRLEVNLPYFRINYVGICLTASAFCVVQSTWSLFVIGALAAAWCVFTKKNEDLTWEVSVAGVPIDKARRRTAFAALSAVILLVVGLLPLGEAFFHLMLICGLLILCHAAMCPSAVELGPSSGDDGSRLATGGGNESPPAEALGKEDADSGLA